MSTTCPESLLGLAEASASTGLSMLEIGHNIAPLPLTQNRKGMMLGLKTFTGERSYTGFDRYYDYQLPEVWHIRRILEEKSQGFNLNFVYDKDGHLSLDKVRRHSPYDLVFVSNVFTMPENLRRMYNIGFLATALAATVREGSFLVTRETITPQNSRTDIDADIESIGFETVEIASMQDGGQAWEWFESQFNPYRGFTHPEFVPPSYGRDAYYTLHRMGLVALS